MEFHGPIFTNTRNTHLLLIIEENSRVLLSYSGSNIYTLSLINCRKFLFRMFRIPVNKCSHSFFSYITRIEGPFIKYKVIDKLNAIEVQLGKQFGKPLLLEPVRERLVTVTDTDS